jgi:flagellar biosynthesis chaperone FliJ
MVMKMDGNSILTKNECIELKSKLNKIYDEIEIIDRQIDMLILKRNNLMNKVESGVAVLIKYSDIDNHYQ